MMDRTCPKHMDVKPVLRLCRIWADATGRVPYRTPNDSEWVINPRCERDEAGTKTHSLALGARYEADAVDAFSRQRLGHMPPAADQQNSPASGVDDRGIRQLGVPANDWRLETSPLARVDYDPQVHLLMFRIVPGLDMHLRFIETVISEDRRGVPTRMS